MCARADGEAGPRRAAPPGRAARGAELARARRGQLPSLAQAAAGNDTVYGHCI